jgi:AcrR family transcriptional regulator
MHYMARPKTAQRERIARATGQLFRHKGYHGTSMADIGEAVGLKKASLYSHVAAKQDVLRELVERGAALFMEGMAPIARSSAPAPERVRRALHMHLRVVSEHPDLAAVFLQEWRQLEGAPRERIGRMRDEYEAMWREIIASGVRDGAFRPDLDVRFATLALLSSANWAYQWFDPRGPLSAGEVADRFADLALDGMTDRSVSASCGPAASDRGRMAESRGHGMHGNTEGVLARDVVR